MKKKSYTPKSDTTTREAVPLLSKDGKGNAMLLCPFCTPPHPINPDSPSICGTILQVRALQTVYKPKKYGSKEVCVKCQKGGFEMVLFQGALVHTHDCTPGVVAMSTPPKYSLFAKFTYGMRDGRLKNFIQKRYGRAVPVEEVTPKGEKTGEIFGYFFNRGINGNNRQGKSTTALPNRSVS